MNKLRLVVNNDSNYHPFMSADEFMSLVAHSIENPYDRESRRSKLKVVRPLWEYKRIAEAAIAYNIIIKHIPEFIELFERVSILKSNTEQSIESSEELIELTCKLHKMSKEWERRKK